jgi:hypothetical protein
LRHRVLAVKIFLELVNWIAFDNWNMKNAFFLLLTNVSVVAFAQTRSITIIDFVKITEGKQKEALFFYENNWKVYRDIALQKEFIKSYKLFLTKADSTTTFDLILTTEYADSTQLKLSESRFQAIIREIRPNGPMLLNDLKPKDFRQNLFFTQAETIYSSEKKEKHKK